MKKPSLKNKPTSYLIKELRSKFAAGKPLDPQQLNFLGRHEKSLSHRGMDDVLKYYLKHLHHDYISDHSFLLPTEVYNKKTVELFKKRLRLLLAEKKKHVVLKFSKEEFESFKAVASEELILTHGNQFLSGAPFHPGGIPHTIFFQWGNLFGVAKYVVLPDEKSLKSNFLIYFEDRQDRELNICVKEYIKKHEPQLLKKPQAETEKNNQISSPYRIPTLSLKIHKNDEKDDKK